MSDENREVELKAKRICRFCMSQDDPLTDIHSKENRLKNSAPLPVQIMSCVSIEVFTNDGMPNTICDDCRMFMDCCYRFKQMCKKSDNALRQYPLTGIWPKSLEMPKLNEELVFKMYPHLNEKHNATTTTLKNNRRDQTIPTVKIYNKSASSTSHPLITVVDIKELSSPSSLTYQQPNIQHQKAPRLLNKNSIKILNKDAQKNIEPILSLPIIKTDSEGNVEIITEIIEPSNDEQEIDPIKNAVPVETNVFPCMHCERSFPLRQLLDIHMVNHNRERNFQCIMCSKSFFSKYDLGKHMLIHTGEKPYKCVVCTKAFTRSTLLHRHEKIHTDQPKFLCVYCEKPFLSKEEMDKHTERHKKHRPFICKICNKAFAFKQGLERHETVHAKDQPYPCQYCDYSFPTPSKLARHLTAHAGERPFPCKLCPKSYLLSHHLTRHLRSHKQNFGDSSYKCFDCEKVFTTRDDLIYHSAVHATETLICPLCKEHFDNLDCVTEHIKNHADGEQFACEFCDLIFMTAEKLQMHSDNEHADDLAAYHEHDKNSAAAAAAENLNDGDIEEFIIEEFFEDEPEEKEQQIVTEENKTVIDDDDDDELLVALPSKNEDKRDQQKRKMNSSESKKTQKSKFMHELEKYNNDIAVEIEKLAQDDENEEFVISGTPPPKIRKLDPKDQKVVKKISEVSTRQEFAVKPSSSQAEVRKSVEERKQQQQRVNTEIGKKIAIKSVLKQLPKSIIVTKKENPISEKSEPAKTSPSQEPSTKKIPRNVSSIKTSPSDKEEAKKTASGDSQKKFAKQITATSKVRTEKSAQKHITKDSPKNSPDIRSRSTSETREKPSSSGVNSKNQRSIETKSKNSSSQDENNKLAKTVFGDREVKEQKIIMSKQQIDLMAKEGKIEIKNGVMILKQNKSSKNNSDNDANSKMMTRSKQQHQRSTNTSRSNK